SSENGGGIHNESGGDFVAVNSTVSENHAKQGGGLHNEGVGTTAVLRSSAVYNNLGYLPPSPVGGVSSVTGTVTLSNTIVAHLFGQVSGVDCSDGGIVSDGSNLDSDGSCGLGADEISNVDDPKLGPLQDNGGPTWTHALLVASPAIDAASVCEATDQRGVARPVGNACDIGPFETAGYDIYLPAILK
ncbi:MAG: hypothetical protein GY803_01950, partial [Chloroflexi bacterium]|nr:hypothetical protein [Chloroflexota bacterium]